MLGLLLPIFEFNTKKMFNTNLQRIGYLLLQLPRNSDKHSNRTWYKKKCPFFLSWRLQINYIR